MAESAPSRWPARVPAHRPAASGAAEGNERETPWIESTLDRDHPHRLHHVLVEQREHPRRRIFDRHRERLRDRVSIARRAAVDVERASVPRAARSGSDDPTRDRRRSPSATRRHDRMRPDLEPRRRSRGPTCMNPPLSIHAMLPQPLRPMHVNHREADRIAGDFRAPTQRARAALDEADVSGRAADIERDHIIETDRVRDPECTHHSRCGT